jgi:membrane protease YdiL (CAAX protease family)
MPLVRFPLCLRREFGVSGQIAKQRMNSGLDGALARFPGLLRDIVTANPELFLPVFLLLVWQASAISVKPRTLGLALVLTFVLLIYAYRVLGTTPWLRRLGWVAPRAKGFWLYGVVAGGVASVAIWGIARLSQLSLGGVPRPNVLLLASSSGPIVEEMLFRGLLFWVIFELLHRRGVSKSVAGVTTVLLIAVCFALAHTDRIGIRFFATILTGITFGWMRVQSGSTAAAAVMHAVYNFVLSCISTF